MARASRKHPSPAGRGRAAGPPSAWIDLPAVPFAHPAMIAVLLLAAVAVLVSVTYQIFDTDYWQHLLVGKTIWATRHVPDTQLWSWPVYGIPDANNSWGFRALVWPFWERGGVLGLFVWRWLVTLATFAILWVAARRMGATGFGALVVVVLGAWVYRQRTQIRPETLVAILMALELAILEARRAGARDRSWAIVALLWVWVNVHISYHFGFVILAVYALDALWRGRRGGAVATPATPGARRLLWVGLAGVAALFVNPFGWNGIWPPFEYSLRFGREPLVRSIAELQSINWSLNSRNGLALFLAGWPLLLLWRARRRGLDVAETLLCAGFTYLATTSQRFIGFYVLVAVPFVARDLADWAGSRRWPRWLARPAARAGLAAALCVAIPAPELMLNDPPFGADILWKNYPVEACDFAEQHEIRGKLLNQLRSGAYVVWRFYPQRDRLPFFDTHLAGTPEMRADYLDAMIRPEGWRRLDGKHRFDWVLLSRPQNPTDHLLDHLDADTSFALVFVDDAGAIYVRRDGPLAAVAARLAYRELGAGEAKLTRVAADCATDTLLRARVRGELARQIADSKVTALSHSLLANLAMAEQRYEEAERELRRALAIDPVVPRAHERLGVAALARGKPYEALVEFERERRLPGTKGALDMQLGMAYQQMGDLARARSAYRRALKRDPGDARVQALLREMDGR